jgi:hypothetical protein
MNLISVITALKNIRPETQVPWTAMSSDSYRGNYSDLAVERGTEPSTVAAVIQFLEDCRGEMVGGWKGGTFYIGDDSEVWFASPGQSSSSDPPAIQFVPEHIDEILGCDTTNRSRLEILDRIDSLHDFLFSHTSRIEAKIHYLRVEVTGICYDDIISWATGRDSPNNRTRRDIERHIRNCPGDIELELLDRIRRSASPPVSFWHWHGPQVSVRKPSRSGCDPIDRII